MKKRLQMPWVAFPKSIQIQTANVCNGHCIMCPYTYKESDKVQYMDDALFEKVIQEIARDSPFKRISITLMLQNEPFLDKSLVDKIRFVKRFDNLFVNTVTNGSIMNEEVLHRLESSGIDSLKISIDSVNEKTFEAIRPGLDFKKVMRNVDLLRNSKLKGKLKVRMILQKKNILEVEGFVNFWKNKGVNVEMYNAANRGGVLKRFDTEIKTCLDLSDGVKRFYKEYRKRKIIGYDPSTVVLCNHPFFKFCILCNGDVIKCCHDWEHKDIAGNVRESAVKEIWTSKFKEYRHLFLAGQGYKIEPCKKCSLYNL